MRSCWYIELCQMGDFLPDQNFASSKKVNTELTSLAAYRSWNLRLRRGSQSPTTSKVFEERRFWKYENTREYSGRFSFSMSRIKTGHLDSRYSKIFIDAPELLWEAVGWRIRRKGRMHLGWRLMGGGVIWWHGGEGQVRGSAAGSLMESEEAIVDQGLAKAGCIVKTTHFIVQEGIGPRPSREDHRWSNV